MEKNFTPGPWEVVDGQICGGRQTTVLWNEVSQAPTWGEDGLRRRLTGRRLSRVEHEFTVANPPLDDGPYNDSSSGLWENDARMISAAPDLLEALEAALECHGDRYSWGSQARAAIAKALGETA